MPVVRDLREIMFERSVAAVPGRARPVTRDLPADGPQVCLLYENEEERDKLSHRLREAGLAAVPWKPVYLGSDKRLSPYLGAVRRSPRRLTDILGAGSVATVAVLSSHWPLIAVLTMSLAPLLLVLWLLRRFSSLRMAAAD